MSYYRERCLHSFCDLTTQFAVRVYGAPINTETQSLIIISSIMAMLCILGASYFFYRNTRRKDYYPVTFGDVVPTVDPAALGNKLGGDGPLTMDANGKGGGKEETTGYFGAGALNARKITKSAQFDER